MRPFGRLPWGDTPATWCSRPPPRYTHARITRGVSLRALALVSLNVDGLPPAGAAGDAERISGRERCRVR